MRFVQGVRDAGRAEGLDADSLERVYARLLHDFRQAEGVCQYPDANSTMRLSYGHVRALEPRDGVSCNWFSTAAGILEKASDDYDYRVDDTLRAIIADEGDGMVVNFITDNDITGGNSAVRYSTAAAVSSALLLTATANRWLVTFGSTATMHVRYVSTYVTS